MSNLHLNWLVSLQPDFFILIMCKCEHLGHLNSTGISETEWITRPDYFYLDTASQMQTVFCVFPSTLYKYICLVFCPIFIPKDNNFLELQVTYLAQNVQQKNWETEAWGVQVTFLKIHSKLVTKLTGTLSVVLHSSQIFKRHSFNF